jgi:hypothetical protein
MAVSSSLTARSILGAGARRPRRQTLWKPRRTPSGCVTFDSYTQAHVVKRAGGDRQVLGRRHGTAPREPAHRAGITNSQNARPLTVGLQVFSSVDQGVDWSVITAATLMTSAPLLVAFLLFQRQFVQSFMRAGIK